LDAIYSVHGGTKQANLSAQHIKDLSISYPPKSEQQRIGLCLSRLDALITLETQEIETLKTHKKGLMQQLFPQCRSWRHEQLLSLHHRQQQEPDAGLVEVEKDSK
jgi:hypothetical protein